MMLGAFLYAAYDGLREGYGFRQLFFRFIITLYIWKAFDIICPDWLLMTKTHILQRYYPETEDCEGYRRFGFNRKEQLIRIAVFSFVAALMAGAAVLIGK